MKTDLECFPCFIKQTIKTAKIATSDQDIQRRIINRVLEKLIYLDLTVPPPKNAPIIYETIAEFTGNKDVYAGIKKKYNDQVLKLYPLIIKKINESQDKIYTALQLSIAGNIIDFGAGRDLDINIEKILNDLSRVKLKVDDYHKFKPLFFKAKDILFLGDNAGEIVFDKAILETINRLYPEKNLYYSVRGEPIINDVTLVDAENLQIDKFATVVSNGTSYPGTIIEESSSEMKNIFFKADLIISKGQGNFETLYQTYGENLFFAFIIKCDLVSQNLNIELNSPVFMKDEKKQSKSF